MEQAPVSRDLGSPSRAAATGAAAPASELDEDFGVRLDRWLSYYRLSVGGAGFLLVVALLREPWVWAFGALYWGLAALVLPLLRSAGTEARKRWVRFGFLLVDVCTVSLFTYAWGTRGSPAIFLYVPIVVGWALVPQRGVGMLALLLVLASLGLLLWFERRDLYLLGPTFPGDRMLFFGLVGGSLVAVHKLLAFIVARMRDHAHEVSRLLAERQSREREAEWAARLEDAQRLEALGRLAGGVAHDFNNLLTALIGCAGLAETKLESDRDAARRALRDIQSAAERGAGLTAQLLDFARTRPAQPSDLDLNRAVRTTSQLLSRLLRDNITLELRSGNEPCGVHLDPSGLERLLLNLGVNAADAMPDGGTLRVKVEAAEQNGLPQVVLEVRDTGVGIAASDLPRIFEPFFTRKERGKGTGLGLASVYGIVKQSGGEIEVESTLGQGTVFRVRWPRIPVVVADDPEPGGIEKLRGRGTLLVVDDDLAVRTVSVEHLRAAGYTVFAAASGEQALAQLAEHDSDEVELLVTDVSMPGMSGLDLGRAVRARKPGMPILLMSGYSDELSRGEAQRIPGVEFIPKPFSGEVLLRAVQRALAQVRAEGERRTPA